MSENDYILVRGQYLQVKSVGIDFNTDLRNSIRFTKDLKNNINNQKFSVGKIPVLQGLIHNVPQEVVKTEKSISIILNKIDQNNMGLLTISFRNACINSLGFLTHDTTINVDIAA